MELTNERINDLNKKIKSLEAQKRTEQRKIREEKRKLEQRRFYIVGEMVVKHFPELAKIVPGNNKQNAENFSGFEAFLQIVSSDEKFTVLFQKFMEQTPKNGGDV